MVRKNEQHETKSSTIDRSNVAVDADKEERAIWAARKARQMPCTAALPLDHDPFGGVRFNGKRSNNLIDEDVIGSKRAKTERSKKTKKEKKEVKKTKKEKKKKVK